jgi:spermidine/putrescine transport system permease protein
MNAAVGRFGKISLSVYFTLLVIFLYVPLVVLAVFSFDNSTIAALPLKGFTTQWYRDAFNNPDLLDAVKLSVKIAFACSLIATSLGVIAAIGLTAPRLRGRSVITAVLMLPLVVPYIVLAIGLLILLNEIGSGPSAFAVLAAHVVIAVPYTILVILPRLRTLDPSLMEAGRDLGSTEFGAFWRITRPLLTPAIISAMIVSFTISFDEYAIASFLVPPGEKTLPIFIYSGTKVPDSRPQLIAIGALVIVVTLLLVLVTDLLRSYTERRQTGQQSV